MEMRLLVHLIHHKGMKKYITTEQLPNILAALQENFLDHPSHHCHINLIYDKIDGTPVMEVAISKRLDSNTLQQILKHSYIIVETPMDEYDVLRETYDIIENI